MNPRVDCLMAPFMCGCLIGSSTVLLPTEMWANGLFTLVTALTYIGLSICLPKGTS